MLTKWIKALLLLLLLGLPVASYLFLQSFGENKYEIPIFYEDGIPDPLPECAENQKPHLIDRFVDEGPCQPWNCSDIDGKLVVFSFIKKGCTTTHLSEIARVCNNYSDQILFQAVTVLLDPKVSGEAHDRYNSLYDLSHGIWSLWPYHATVASLVQCGFNLSMDCNSSEQVVLVDNLFQIRGYYLASDPQDMDRLVTEITLLLMETEN